MSQIQPPAPHGEQISMDAIKKSLAFDPSKMRTDQMLQPLGGRDCVTGERIEVVHADDCRRIELEKMALTRELADTSNELNEVVQILGRLLTGEATGIHIGHAADMAQKVAEKFAPSEIEPQSGETPRTDKNYIRGFEALTITKDEDQWVRADFARTLERELAEAKAGREFQSAQVDRIVVEEVAATKAAKERAKKAEAEVAALKRDAALWEARAYQQAFMADGETAERYWAKIDKRIASNPPAEQEQA